MSREPRDQALAAMLRATVRVGDASGVVGSGVVIRNGNATLVATAHHVVEGDGPHCIWWRDGFVGATVLAFDEAADVAVLAAPPQVDDIAVTLANTENEAAIGDDVWATGFPGGWQGADPVLARGVVAGFGPRENWIDIDGTWGNSGGPISRVIDGAGRGRRRRAR